MRRFLRMEFSKSQCKDSSAGEIFGSCQWEIMVHHMHPQKREIGQGTGVNILKEPHPNPSLNP